MIFWPPSVLWVKLLHMTETVDKGRTSFDALLPRMHDLSEDEIASITINVETAAMAVLSIATSLKEDKELSARFHSLPNDEFDHDHLDELDRISWATIHAHKAAAEARSRSSSATLPADLVARAGALEQRMQRCCEYYLTDHPVAGPSVEHLRKGTGYRDLAHDLLGYAALYRDYDDIVSTDKKYYREGDVEDAVSIGEQIIELLGGGWNNEDQETLDNYVRAWTLLRRSYNEVRDTGHWLLRRDPALARQRLPALAVLGRIATSGSADAAEDDPGESAA